MSKVRKYTVHNVKSKSRTLLSQFKAFYPEFKHSESEIKVEAPVTRGTEREREREREKERESERALHRSIQP